MIRIAILEDDKVMLTELRKYLDLYERENAVRWNISLFTDEQKLLLDCKYCSDYQVILMDMDQRREDKFSAITKIRETDKNCVILLLSSNEGIYQEGYRVEASGCLLKPVTYRKFEELLLTVLKPLEEKSGKSILFSVPDGIRKVPESRILFMEKKGDRFVCHSLDGDFDISESMEDISGRLTKDTFFPCGKLYLLNLENVDGIQENVIRVGEKQVTVTPAESLEAIGALNRYLSEVGL